MMRLARSTVIEVEGVRLRVSELTVGAVATFLDARGDEAREREATRRLLADFVWIEGEGGGRLLDTYAFEDLGLSVIERIRDAAMSISSVGVEAAADEKKG